jgi:hypothetical protein
VLAAHLLWQMWTETAADEHFWKAILILDSALKKSPANYHLKFLLIKFFNQAGDIRACLPRVARWFIFKQKIPIWVSFGGP